MASLETVLVKSSWCNTQMSEKLSRAGSNETCVLRRIPVSKQLHLHPNKAGEQSKEFNINRNIIDVVFPLSTLSTQPQNSFNPFSTPTCCSMLLNPTAMSQHLPYHQYLTNPLPPSWQQLLSAWLPRHPPISFGSLLPHWLLLLSLVCYFFHSKFIQSIFIEHLVCTGHLVCSRYW